MFQGDFSKWDVSSLSPPVNSESVTQTPLCVLPSPEGPAAPGRAAVQPGERAPPRPAVCPEWRGDWGGSRSQSPSEAAGTAWGLVELWRRGLAFPSTPKSPDRKRRRRTHHISSLELLFNFFFFIWAWEEEKIKIHKLLEHLPPQADAAGGRSRMSFCGRKSGVWNDPGSSGGGRDSCTEAAQKRVKIIIKWTHTHRKY